MKLSLLLLLDLLLKIWGQIDSTFLQHRAVVQTLNDEARLPPHLRSPFYMDQRIRRVLEQKSWFHEGEKPVFARESDNISRNDIFLVLKHAGLLPQQQQQQPY